MLQQAAPAIVTIPQSATPPGRRERGYPEAVRPLRLTALAAALALAAAVPATASALSLQTVATGIAHPTAIAFRPGNPWPVVTSRDGIVYAVVKSRVSPLADLSDRVAKGSEQGLLGIAYSPDYRTDRLVFVSYADTAGNTKVVRFRRGKYGRFVMKSATTLFSLHRPYANHSGGSLAFGPDRLLYVAMGDGGSGGDPGNRAQNPLVNLGKVLRVDVLGQALYGIPPGNPFADGRFGNPAVWALGMRMPQISFDAKTGALWAVDALQSGDQEVDVVGNPAPRLPNFGWAAYDGTHEYKPQPTAGRLIRPLQTYGSETGCFAIGGAVSRAADLPTLNGRYVFGDRCTGAIMSLRPTKPDLVDSGLRVPGVAAIAADADGRPWAIGAHGALSRITP